MAAFKQPASLKEMSLGHRWLILIIGLIETGLWSGTIFGWASLVHVMKTRGVFSHLCDEKVSKAEWNGTIQIELFRNETVEDLDAHSYEVTRGCGQQDEQFTLIGTVAMVLYSAPGIVVGYALHHLGQAFTRIMASILVSLGFILLSFTSEATPTYLWGASILVSVGGNMIRVACFEFGNLFPERRNTAMGIISGIYTISAALFMVIQSLFEAGYGWEMICQLLAVGASLMVLTTFFIPRYHIPHSDDEKEDSTKQLECHSTDSSSATSAEEDGLKQGVRKVYHENTNDKPLESCQIPLSKSVFSISMGLLQFWLFNNMFAVTIFGTYFNSWISKFSENNDEAAYYSRLFGYANILCLVVTPLPGLFIDLLSAYYRKGKKGVAEKVTNVRVMIAPMMFISITITIQISCFFFFSSWAVYLGLFCLIINRPGCLGVGIPFVRSRFPAEHFNRMIGIQGTLVSLLSVLQYPHFTWTQSNYFLAIGTLVGLLALSILHPLHLLNKKYLYRVFDSQSQKNKTTSA